MRRLAELYNAIMNILSITWPLLLIVAFVWATNNLSYIQRLYGEP